MELALLNFTDRELSHARRSIEYKGDDTIEFLKKHATNYIDSKITWTRSPYSVMYTLEGFINYDDDERKEHVATITI